MSDMEFYARLHAEAKADEAERHGQKILALVRRAKVAAMVAKAREVKNERGN